jgi:hypothetical protein
VRRAAASRTRAVQTPNKVKFLAGDELAASLANLRQSVARRAYEFYEMRGGVPGHESEDWARAEAEIMRPLPANITDSGGYFTLRGFVPEPGISQIGFEARRILVWTEGAAGLGETAAVPGVLTFELSQAIDPSGSSADSVGQVLTIRLAKAANREKESLAGESLAPLN